MIVGSLTHWPQERTYAHPVIRKAIDFLQTAEFSQLDNGKHPIWGQDMYALVSSIRTKPASQQPAEKHEVFLDIHYVIEGEETIGWQLQDDRAKPFECSPEEDYSLFTELDAESMIRLKPGMYAVLYPEDIHRPGLTEAEPSDVRKAVIKINRHLF
ncbi:hypothetical protein BK138_30245 [Paenibacillus rhizosphaerae]|uniref:YhcH/YjgK/YiaL family protein n=1 Tax=Paenibacillus rhizosphaerae TaxID=297318 RepID=A0A1R1ECB9_9BACL|nr:YhcH/YjgK/YiaL family protein [Paenibacillus rhizosphaerae]OMF49473.1 hypothetical protein BK138_30245 [Paenibacillus rhizosphaerae]